MSTMHDADPGTGARREVLGRLDMPAQAFAAIAGVFLTALGVLALVLHDVSFGTIGALADQPELVIWTVSGWTAILWIAMGALGLLSMGRLDAATAYSLLAGVVFAAAAVWGFVNGSEVAGIFAAGTANNVTHAILAGVGLVAGMLPREAQTPREPVARTDHPAGRRRFEGEARAPRADRRTAGRR